MAFEYYSGSGNANAIINKLIEMWDFDSSDTTSSDHSATYGNAQIISGSNNLFVQTVRETTSGLAIFCSYTAFKIIKATNSIMVCIDYNGYYGAIIIGNLTNSDGQSSKGIFGHNAQSTEIASIMGASAIQSKIQFTPKTSDTLTQLVPMAAPTFGDWYFENGYRIEIATVSSTILNGTHGLYDIGGEKYYFAGNVAIKED